MINWLVFTNGCIIGMVFSSNIIMWKKINSLKDQLQQLITFKRWEQFINNHPGESASDLAYLKEKGFIK
ncbi:MAG: hypothetical protein WA324_27760 [Bryobacteraceae bacterium]